MFTSQFRDYSRVILLIIICIICISGCLGFSVRIRTVVDKRDACLRQVDYSGPEWERFLMPSSEPWQVTLTDSGAIARAQFTNPNNIGQDLIYDASVDVTDEQWQEFIGYSDTSALKADGMRLNNSIDFFKNNYFIFQTYKYYEKFDKH